MMMSKGQTMMMSKGQTMIVKGTDMMSKGQTKCRNLLAKWEVVYRVGA